MPFVEQSSLAYSVAWAPPEYVANGVAEGPGVISFRQPTTQGDIWSFGCLFYEVGVRYSLWTLFLVSQLTERAGDDYRQPMGGSRRLRGES